IILDINGKDRELLRNGHLYISVAPTRSGDLLVADFPMEEALWDADVQFFPEGGDLLAGVAKKVAIKAIGSDGRGLPVRGRVLDGAGTEVAAFEDIHLGMGHFMLTPQAGQAYTAEVTFDNGASRSFALPEVAAQGVNIAVLSSTGEQLELA